MREYTATSRFITTGNATGNVIGMATGILLGILGLFASGCDGPEIDPFIQGEHFTVWGYISPFADTHFVRVIPVRRFPEEINSESDPHAEIDAVVTSTDISTGQTVRWRHSLRRLDDGSFGHIFSATITIRAGARYRLTVTRSDGATSVAETVVPSGIEAEVLPAAFVDGQLTQTIRWKDVATPENMYVVYCARPPDGFGCFDGEDGAGLILPYGRQGTRVGDDWEVVVDLSRDFDYLRIVSRLPEDTPLVLTSLRMKINALDSGWRVLSDPNEFAQPTALDNIEDGFGYWGSIGVSVLDWFPEEEALRDINVTLQPSGG